MITPALALKKICRLQGMWVEHKYIFSWPDELRRKLTKIWLLRWLNLVGKNSREKGVA